MWAALASAAAAQPQGPPPDPQTGAGAEGQPGQIAEISYILEEIRIVGNHRTRASVVRSFVKLKPGSALDVDDPAIEVLRYRLLGTGWFDRVDLRLERGSAPGRVVLVIEVQERNTLVFRKLAAGLGWSVTGVRREGDQDRREAQPYLGLGFADVNFLGLGSELGGEGLLARNQQGLSLYYADPVVSGSRFSLRAGVLFVNGQEYFGGDNDVLATVDCSDVPEDERGECQSTPRVAVVDYWRTGWNLGTGTDIGRFTRARLEWRADVVKVPPGGMPTAASEIRGRGDDPTRREPIDFAIDRGTSFVSMARMGLEYDRRDNAALPSRGGLVHVVGDLAGGLLGSDYEFVRLQAQLHRWEPLPWKHVVRFGLYGGAVFGDAPFFYKFFVSDLTDLQPSRILGVNLDHRPAPNLIGILQGGEPFDASKGTAIAQMRNEELAARADLEYIWPFVRGRQGFLKSGDVFFLVGAYLLADRDDLSVAVPGYEGAARAPIDLTFDVGVRLDTEIGVFRFGFTKLGWLAAK